MNTTVLRVAFPANDDVFSYDPSKIFYAHQYILLENLFSQLVTYDTKGEIVSGIAERFEWAGSDARFVLRKNLTTIDGDKIDAHDVVLSMKRLFILQSNTHGDLGRLLCGGKILKSLEDNCENLCVENDYTLVMHFPRKDPFLFSMLTSVDFSVLPKRSVDNKTLKIIDFRNTSGPYYVEGKTGSTDIELAANPSHFCFSNKMPQRVKIVPALEDKRSRSLQLFKERSVDMLTTAEISNSAEIMKYSEASGDVELFKTIPIKLAALTFTPTGVLRLSIEERFQISALIKKIILPKLLNGGGAEAAPQLFPSFGQGALSSTQLKELESKSAMGKEDVFKGKFTVWNLPKDYWPDLQKHFPNAEFKYIMALPGHADYKKLGLEEPELFFHRTDTSIKEDISFFSYYMSGYFFSVHGEKGAAWVSDYAKTENLETRMRILNQLHFDTLISAITVPLTFSPYVAAVRKPWHFDFFALHAGTTFWRLKWD